MVLFADQHRWKHIEMIPQERLDLAKEIQLNPELCAILQGKYEPDPDNFELIMAETAAFLGVGLDDLYTAERLNELCVLLTERLVTLRGYEFDNGKIVVNPLIKIDKF